MSAPYSLFESDIDKDPGTGWDVVIQVIAPCGSNDALRRALAQLWQELQKHG